MKDRQEYETLQADIAQDPWNLEKVFQLQQNNFLTPEQYFTLSSEAIKKTPLVFSKIPYPGKGPLDHAQYLELCQLAIGKNYMTLLSIPKPDKNVLSKEEYYSLCAQAVQKNGVAIKYIPIDLFELEDYKKLCLMAAQENGECIDSIPQVLFNFDDYKEICHAALTQNAMALSRIPQPGDGSLSEENYTALCVTAVQINSMALELIFNEEIKKYVIDELTPDYILSNDFSAHNFFPESYDEAITHFLSTIEHVVVTDSTSDHEINDTYFVYAAKHKKTMRVDQADIDSILQKLNDLEVKEIRLVLLGHGDTELSSLASLTVDEIANFAKENDFISRITLLSCNTAKSKPLEEEKEKIKNFSAEEKKRLAELSDCGFVIMSAEGNLNERLAEIKNVTKLANSYVLMKTDAATFHLAYIENNELKKLMALDEKQANKIQGVVNQGKPFKFPEDSSITPFRTKQKPLNTKEQDKLLYIYREEPKFDKAHPQYQQQKQKHSYMQTMRIGVKEAKEKLLDSLLKKLVEAIEDLGIERPLELKGYVEMVHVATESGKQGLIVSKTPVFASRYDFSFWNKKTDNIDRDKVEEDQKHRVTKAKTGVVGEKTQVRAIIVKK